jgi:RND superfamily putative drug exporter
VLFGLSMDYEVYLVARMHEEWQHRRPGASPELLDATHDPAQRNRYAVLIGQAKSGRVIAAAAAIMVLVFGSFLLESQRQLQEFGFGLAFSVLIDALIVRSLLVPALMHLIGPANWTLPTWLDKVLPRVSIEAEQSPTTRHAEREPAQVG